MNDQNLTVEQVAELASQFAPQERLSLLEHILLGLKADWPVDQVSTAQDRSRRFAEIRAQTVDLGLTDLAREHDHYLYGTPKRDTGSES
jgi:hypothetical protein